jgi:hypothetical protein
MFCDITIGQASTFEVRETLDVAELKLSNYGAVFARWVYTQMMSQIFTCARCHLISLFLLQASNKSVTIS